MATYTAHQAADTVGSPTTTVSPVIGAGALVAPTSGYVAYPGEYMTLQFIGTSLEQVLGFTNTASPQVGADDLKFAWRADPGDVYVAADLTALLFTPTTTTETVQQFYFSKDDKIKGSEFDDKLCGWAEDDKMWGFDGDDTFYYGKGMGKDTICDFDKKDDAIVIDDGFAKKFKKIKKIKYNEKKEFAQIKNNDGDKLKIYGIDTEKELKKALSFDDFTDFA